MQFRGLCHLVVAAALCVGVVGCSHKSKNGVNGSDSGYGASTQGAGDGSEFSSAEQRDLLAKRKFYFEYDRSDLSEGDYEVVYAHAEFLKNNPNHHVRVEGHADEHGSREYNIALGERRARTVANALMSQGVAPHQVATVSYGKEKPEAMGHDEEACRLNRRAVVVYEN